MNLYHLRYFVQLAHQQHYTKAAEQLCITQPSLSHAISQLEKELGVPLFEKSKRNTRLTQLGEQFLACVESALTTLDSGVEALQRTAKGAGLVRLGILRTLGIDFIPQLVQTFQQQYPDNNIQFTFGINVTQKLLDGLKEHRYDLVFASKPNKEQGFDFVPVDRQDLVLIVPRDHPLANRFAVDLAETSPYPYVYFSRDSGLRYVVDGLFEKINETPQIAYEIEEDQVIAGMVAHRFGIAVVPYMDMLLRLNVKILQISRPTWERKFYMIADKHTYLPPAAQKFQQFVLDKQVL